MTTPSLPETQILTQSSRLSSHAIEAGDTSSDRDPRLACTSGEEVVTGEDPDTEENVSSTSTEEYEHEAFDSFQSKVKALCQDLWPNVHPISFKIVRINGGGFNRVIGISIDPPRKKQSKYIQLIFKILSYLRVKPIPVKIVPEHLIIRIPRSPNAWIEHEIGVLNFLNRNGVAPVPSIKLFDLKKNNKIGERYTIQPRIPGRSIIDTDDMDVTTYERLSTKQRIAVARDISAALKSMRKIFFDRPGTLDPDTHVPHNAPGLDERQVGAKPQPVFDFLIKQCDRQRQYDISCNREATNPWPMLKCIFSKMNSDLGLFDDNSYYLTHMDFEPRNLLVDIVDEENAKLTGILVWDEAVLAPVFMNCKPPSWLWDFEGDEDLDESKANDIPPSTEMAEIKQAFEDAVGPAYLKYAYRPEYRWARTICRLAITCIHSNQDYEDVDNFISEWNNRYPEWKQKRIWELELKDMES